MTTQRLFILIFLPIALLFSCTIEKRVYRSGYHIEWRKPAKVSNEATSSEKPLIRHETAVSAETRTLPETVDTTLTLPDGVVLSPQTVSTSEIRQDKIKTPLLHLPERLQKQKVSQTVIKTKPVSPSEKQLKQSQQKAGLLLAPLRILFTILLIALVIVGVVLLFVLESALGGTVLLAAGAVLLILIIL